MILWDIFFYIRFYFRMNNFHGDTSRSVAESFGDVFKMAEV